MDALIMSTSTMIAEFHFLRPEWLFALIPAFIGGIWLFYRQKQTGNWDQVISPQLLPFLLDSIPAKQRRSLPLLAMIGWALTSFAMAGPTWEHTPLPVHKQENALVIIFDLSPSMMVQDLKPNRLTRARLKIIDLLQQRQEGTTGLVAYAGDSFIVSPLTDDADTVAALIPALDPNIMPSHGSQVETAIEQAIELVLNANLAQGNFLLVTDGVSASAQTQLNKTIKEHGNFGLSILGIGTEDGAPIPLGNGGFAKDKSGSIVIPRLDIHNLQKLANLNGGRFTQLTADDTDIHYLSEQFNAGTDSPSKQLERTFDSWDDQGYWLIFPVILILLLAFRRGLLACLLIAPMLSMPQTSYAFGWDDLWATNNQQAAKAMNEGDTATAQQLFKDPNWKAAAAYRNDDFETAGQLYGSTTDNIDNNTQALSHYNQANALAKSGKLEEAIKHYDEALTKNPGNEDAKFNKELVNKLLEQQQQQQQNGDSSDQQEKQDQQQDGQQSEGGDSQGDQSQDNQSQNEPSQNDQSQNKESQEENSQDSNSQETKPQENSSEDDAEQQAQQQKSDKDTKDSDQPQPTENQEQNPQQSTEEPSSAEGPITGNTQTEKMTEEEKQAMEQWLRKIPDDPGGLLREKFRYEAKKRTYERRRGINQSSGQSEERW